MKETQPSRSIDTAQKPRAGEQGELKPQGIGMAVAFDWGVAVQVLVTPFLPLFLGSAENNSTVQEQFIAPIVSVLPLSSVSNELRPYIIATVSFLFSLPFAIMIIIFGEGIRRGWRWTRPIQITFNTLGFLGGLAALIRVWQGSKVGDYWPIVPAVILLIFSPLIAWRLSRPATAHWFATVKSTEARKRHGGVWPWLILLWAIGGGVLQAVSAFSSSTR